MNGPEIFARSLTKASISDKFGNSWQYNSRSDHHSKIACWTMLFDLMQNCPLLLDHVNTRKVGFGINHEMSDFRMNRKKNLDLVVCTPGETLTGARTFSDLAKDFGVDLTAPEEAVLAALPELTQVAVGTVHLALEAKACMTAHIKACPRLHDELNSSHLAIHGSADYAIAAGFTVVNCSDVFFSSVKNGHSVADKPLIESKHKQPNDTARVIQKLKEIPRRTSPNAEGFDALGIVVVDFQNDGSPVRIETNPPAPAAGDVFGYDQMIRRIAGSYASKFANI